MTKRMGIVVALAGIVALAGGCNDGTFEDSDGGTDPTRSATVAPQTAVDIPCEPETGWRRATSALDVTLDGDWGTSPSVRLAGDGGVVRIAGRPAPVLRAPLNPSALTALTLEADLGSATPLPATVDLEFLDSDGTERETVTIDLRLGGSCDGCSIPGTATPLMFEWQVTSGSPGRDIGLSNGGPTPTVWMVLEDWLSRTGNGQVESPTVSPDGQYLAFVAHPSGSVSANSVHLLDLQATDDPKRLTPAVGYDWSDLEWSNGTVQLPGMEDPAFVLACVRLDLPNLSRKQITLLPAPADPAGLPTLAESTGTVRSRGSFDRVHPTWSPDDSRIAYLDLADNSLWSVPSDGSAAPEQELDARSVGGLFPLVANPRWHPTDADRIAFNSTGSIWVYHRSTGVSEQYAVGSPADPRYHAAWTREGEGLVYIRGVTAPTLTLLCDGGTEQELFSLPGAEVRKIRIPRTPEAIAVLENALAP